MFLKAKTLKKVRVGVGLCGHSPFELSFFDWRFGDIFDKKELFSLISLTAPGRPVLVFFSTCCISQDVCCEVR